MTRNLITTLLVLTVAASSAHADTSSLVLRNRAVVAGPEVRLRDVAELTGPLSAELGQFVVGVFRDEPTVTVRMADIQRFISTRDFNQGKLSVRGFATCSVQRPVVAAISTTQPASDTSAAARENMPAAVSDAPATANPQQNVDRTTATTVRDRIVDLVERMAGVDRADLRLVFNNEDVKTLSINVLQEKVDIQPTASIVPGRLPLIVHKYQGDAVVGTYRVNVDVSRRYLAVVAKNAIARGASLSSGDVEVREVWVGNAAVAPITDLKAVVGNVCAAPLRAGAIVTTASIQSPVLIKRGDVVKVRSVKAGIVVTIEARATEEGSLGQTIQCRSDKTRATFTATVTGAGQVTLSDGGGGEDAGPSASDATIRVDTTATPSTRTPSPNVNRSTR